MFFTCIRLTSARANAYNVLLIRVNCGKTKLDLLTAENTKIYNYSMLWFN